MWFSPFCGLVAGMAEPARARSALPQSSRYGSARECRSTACGSRFGGKGSVGQTLWRHLDTQWHQEMLVAEGVEERNLADRLREQLHRDRIGFEALYILSQVVKIEADVLRLSRNASVL